MVDAAQAFRYARGAMWHLEVALPELRSNMLVEAAAAHIDGAARDLASAGTRSSGITGVDDAVLGQVLTTTARHLRSGGIAPGAAADIVATARLRVQQSIDTLAPHLESPQEMLSLTPGASAPRSELALIDDVAVARGFRRTSSIQRSQAQRILTEGTIDPDPVRWVGGYGNGNGAMPMVRVRHPKTPHLSVLAVQRPPTAQAAQEEFFARLAEHAGTDHFFAPVARRADGSALVLAVPGKASWESGVSNGDDVRHLLGDWYRGRFAALSDEQIREAGFIDFDELRTMDYLVANPDRNAGGLLVQRDAGEVHYIDNGLAGRGELPGAIRPGLKSHFVGGVPGHVDLHPVAAHDLSQALTDDALADAHAILGRGPDGDLHDGYALALRQDASRGYLEALRARRNQIATGSFDYEPIELNANPIAHMDHLRGNHHPF